MWIEAKGQKVHCRGLRDLASSQGLEDDKSGPNMSLYKRGFLGTRQVAMPKIPLWWAAEHIFLQIPTYVTTGSLAKKNINKLEQAG